MERSISKINSAKASTSKPLGKPRTGGKLLGNDEDVCFYETEGGDNVE